MCVQFAVGQEKNELKWYNPAKETSLTVHNQLWNGKEIKSFYDRLPTKAEPLVRKEVWALSENAAGLKLVFKTNAQEIIVRYTTSKDKSAYAMPHFSSTGVSGLDLFTQNADGIWRWVNAKYEFKDTITYAYRDLSLDETEQKNGRIFHLYLPLYNDIKWLEIGIPTGSAFKFIPVFSEKPIVVYGTSIAQGGCASRPGMAWTNILNRALNIPVANLGFSGNGKLEKEVVDLMLEKEARVFVLDCLPNLGGEIENVKTKISHTVNTIRTKYPQTPIVLVDDSYYKDSKMNNSKVADINAINKASFGAYQALKLAGVKRIYYLKREVIGLDMNDSVDGIHPTDIGMLKYAKAYEKLIKAIIKLKQEIK